MSRSLRPARAALPALAAATLAALGAGLAAAPAAAQVPVPVTKDAPAATSRASASRFEFTIANMMRGPEVYGREPQNVRWSPDARWIYFSWLPPGTAWQETPKPYRVRAQAGATPERVSPAHMDSVGPLLAAGALSPDRRMRAVTVDGDVYLVDAARGTTRRLTDTPAVERSPSWDSAGRRVFFLRDNNVWAIDVGSGLLSQLTDVRQGEPPADPKPAVGQRGALEQQQRELFEVIRDEVRQDSVQRAERLRRDSLRLAAVWLGRTERLTDMAVSPTGRGLLLQASTPPTPAPRQTLVPSWVTESGYTEELNVRTKVGDAQEATRIAFVSLPSAKVTWLPIVPGDKPAAPAFASIVGWNETGDAAIVSATSRDFKTRWLHLVDASGAVRTLDVLTDSAWVQHPCQQCVGWYDGGRRAYFVSERDGYAHLYTIPKAGGQAQQLTSGRFEVMGVRLSDDGRSFELTTSEGSPFEQHFYRMATSGGARTRVTSGVGSHAAVVSPDGRLIANVYSTSNRPPELFVMANRPGAPMAQLTTSPTAEWLSHPWVKPEIVMIPASDGVEVPARIYRPEEWGAQPNGAAAIFVHGAGYLHNVHNFWSSYAREYMFNQYLASQGYVVLDIDYRGSAGYGRDWRTAIYRHMGGRDLQDHVDGSRYLKQRFGIDPERVGIYGGSYGGFITLMALFTEPEHFGAGAGLRSVTDWAHYNHVYTGRILNLPDTDTLAYRRSSPIYFADGLQDPLLIAHGMVDVNVHFSDVVRLAQRLIELGKTDWEMAVYPVEDHAFVRPSSWTDEYRRIYELFERHLPSRVPARATTSGPQR